MTDSDGRWTPPPEIPGSVRSLKKLLDECRKKNVAMYDCVEALRSAIRKYEFANEFVPDVGDALGPEKAALESHDKAMEQNG